MTACTDGIGLGFSQILAQNGINIIQVGRNPSKLQQCASDLNSKYGVQVKSITKDFLDCPSNPAQFFSDIFEQCKDLDISILVNNVGFGAESLFLNSSESVILQQNALNLWPIVYLSRLFLEKLGKRAIPGYVINLSSIISLRPTACGVLYAAGKSFDKVFSLICNGESKVKVLCLTPGFVLTPMEQKLKLRPLEISSKECATSALNTLGSVNITCGHWKHWIVSTLMNIIGDLADILYPIINK